MKEAASKDAYVRKLRDDFDRSFAEPVASAPATTSILTLRVGGDRYAVRLEEIAGLHRDKAIVPVASVLPELLGLTAFRSTIVPVYDLAHLLGYPASKNPRWQIVAAGAPAVAFAFEAFEANLRVELNLLQRGGSDGGQPHVWGAMREKDGTCTLIRVASLVKEISVRSSSIGPAKER